MALDLSSAMRILPLLSLLAGCGQPPVQAPPPGPAPKPHVHCPATQPGTAVYVVDADASLVAVKVGRAGPMARLGHEHVVASHSLAGHADPSAGCALVSFRLDQLSVDEPQLLRETGIDSQPSPQAVEGTRRNMLGPVLDAQRYPLVTLHAARSAGGRMRVDVTLHGVTRRLDLPAAVQASADQVSASGTALLKQSDFGITPFSVGGGLLAVRDELEIRYRIVALRVGRRRPPAVSP